MLNALKLSMAEKKKTYERKAPNYRQLEGCIKCLHQTDRFSEAFEQSYPFCDKHKEWINNGFVCDDFIIDKRKEVKNG